MQKRNVLEKGLIWQVFTFQSLIKWLHLESLNKANNQSTHAIAEINIYGRNEAINGKTQKPISLMGKLQTRIVPWVFMPLSFVCFVSFYWW